jgi:murein DD-endopeptidase MepM/ murein hydrolase activator NlpD
MALAIAFAVSPRAGRSAPTPKSPANARASVSLSSSASAAIMPERPNGRMPSQWLPSRGRECIRRGPYRGFCQGPRRAPRPFGPAAELAQQLGLGGNKAVSHLLLEPAKPEWLEAAGIDTGEPLYFPVKEGMIWRGLQRAVRTPKRKRHAHKGIDIGAREGSKIHAVQNGLVVYADNGVRGYGNLLVTVHPDGSSAMYAHCRAIYVFPGQLVARAQIVGEVGHTGIARGTHLHFEFRKDGRVRDPLKLFPDRPEMPLELSRKLELSRQLALNPPSD